MVEFEDELWELVVAEAGHSGVSVSGYVRDAVIARLIVGPIDPRTFEVFATAIREAARDEPDAATRRGAERSLSALARLSAVRRQREAQAQRAQSAQIIRMTQRRLNPDAAPARAPAGPEPATGPESAVRISPDWGDIRAASSRPPSTEGDAPDVTWLQGQHIHPEDREGVRDALAHATERRAMLDVTYRVQFGAMVRRVRLRALPLLDGAGTITEWVAVAAEPTDDPR
jgi:hypothetical protein